MRRGTARAILHINPLQGSSRNHVSCDVEIVDERLVMSSGGHRERRIVIVSTIAMGDAQWPIELTVTDRDSMRFRVLLGRSALAGRALVNPDASYLLGKPRRRSARQHRS
jgi:hypothetical protein